MPVVDPNKQRSQLWQTIEHLFLIRVWSVHIPVIMVIQATPAVCLQALKIASRPSAHRLQHRNLFIQGRRYQLQEEPQGFRLTTTYSIRWRHRRRTAEIAVVRGQLEVIDDNITRLSLNARIKLSYLLDILLIPAYTGSILIFMPWNPLVVVFCLLILILLSFIGHRTNAMLEAAEMIWFVQRALEDFVPAEILSLNSRGEEIIEPNADFSKEWERFYAEHKNER